MPSPAVLADEGVRAVAAGKYAEGINKLSEALKERPAPLWLLERSKAYLRTNELELALYDAERGLQVAFERANRDQMIEGQIRRAVTLFRLGRYADADICAFWALRLIDKSKATEDDGQQNKVDENGEYAVLPSDITPTKPSQDQGLAAAMGSTGGRSKEISLRNQAFSWRLQALTQLEKLPAGHPGRKVKILEKYPKPQAPPASKAEQKSSSIDLDDDDDDDDQKDYKAETDKPSVSNGAGAEAPELDTWEKLWERYRIIHARNNIRSSFYQTESTINADFFVKNVPADRFSLEAGDGRKIIMGPISNADPVSIQLHLWDRIKPAEIKCTVKPMKVELVLQKETRGKWPKLQRDGANIIDNISISATSQPSFPEFSASVSRTGYKDPRELGLPDFNQDQNAWYNVLVAKLEVGVEASGVSAATSLSKAPNPVTGTASPIPDQTPSTQLKDDPSRISNVVPQATRSVNNPSSVTAAGETPVYPTSSKKGPVNWDKFSAGDGDDDDEDGKDDVNKFFQRLYKDADDDTRRAMMKSYIESNGTSLSTSWAEAKDKTYKTHPPDGAEAKTWDE
ncbi:Cochaperone protein [Parahypoxylon ruwenzoriense]